MLRSIFPEFVRGRGAVGLLLLRLAVGAAFVFHGWYKINKSGGLTGWMGPDAPVPGFLQAAAALSEFAGGIGLILGLLTPVAAFFLAVTMIVAIGMVHLPAGDPFVSPKGGRRLGTGGRLSGRRAGAAAGRAGQVVAGRPADRPPGGAATPNRCTILAFLVLEGGMDRMKRQRRLGSVADAGSWRCAEIPKTLLFPRHMR